MFTICKDPLETMELKNCLSNPQSGAMVTFEGWVRNHNDGLGVSALEYEAFEELCISEGLKIIEEAKAKFKVFEVKCIHRVGLLNIGEMAVWVGASSAHRKASFDACQYLIDELKVRLPIWKKEYYLSGHHEWVNCQQCAQHGHHQHQLHFLEQDFYKRQTVLPEVGEIGQNKIKSAKVLVVGAGGLGSPSLQYLVGAGIGTVGICDGDRIDVSNLPRQILFGYNDVGSYKADVAKEKLSQLNPFVDFMVHREHIDFENAERIIQGYDLILDCTDNFTAKFLVHDVCWNKKIPLIQGAVYQWEGQIQSFWNQNEHSSCLRCLWDEFPERNVVGNCAEVGIVGSVVGVMGTLQANEAIRFLLQKDMVNFSETLIVDLKSNSIDKMLRPKNPDCSFCKTQFKEWKIQPYNYAPKKMDWEIEGDIEELKRNGFKFIDVRDDRFCQTDFEAYPKEDQLVLVCRRGNKSYRIVKEMRDAGFHNIYSYGPGIKDLELDIL